MPDERPITPYPIARLPTLTEVLELGRELPAPAWPELADPPVLVSEVPVEPMPAVEPTVQALMPTPEPEPVPGPVPESTWVPASMPLPSPAPVPGPVPERAAPVVAAAPAAAIDADEIVARVLAQLEPRIASMLQARVDEALAPALARAADGLIRDSREQLGVVLHELVREALAQVLRDAARFERHAP